MKKVSLDVWVQLIGMFSIVGLLIFVGLEMMQSQTIALAGQVQARNQMLLDNQLVFLGEEPIGRQILAAGLLEQSTPNTLSEEEYAVWRAMVERNGPQNLDSLLGGVFCGDHAAVFSASPSV